MMMVKENAKTIKPAPKPKPKAPHPQHYTDKPKKET